MLEPSAAVYTSITQKKVKSDQTQRGWSDAFPCYDKLQEHASALDCAWPLVWSQVSTTAKAQDRKGWHGLQLRLSLDQAPALWMESHPPCQAYLPLLYAKPLSFHSDKLLQSSHLFVGHLHISCGAGLVSVPKQISPEAPQCSGKQCNDQLLWRPPFPFCLRTQLRQSLFKLMFFHSKHMAIFFLL